VVGLLLVGISTLLIVGQGEPAGPPTEEAIVQVPTATPSPTPTSLPPTETPLPTSTGTPVVLPTSTNTTEPVVQEDLQPVAITEPEDGAEETPQDNVPVEVEPTEEPLSEAIPKSGGVLVADQNIFLVLAGVMTLILLIAMGLFTHASRR